MTTGVIKLQRISKGKLNYARELRRKMTNAETILWKRLRGKQLGVKFRRQQIIEGFVADFFCEKAWLVIEVDGCVHNTKEQALYDEHRRKVFENRGLEEIRFTNELIINDIDVVVRAIMEKVAMRNKENRTKMVRR